MRVAALAFGVLAGLVASLILALGGLDVTAATAASADRQAQAIRFGLFVIGNIGVFGAALALAAPLAGGILLLLGAVAWVGAALLLHHSTDFVLITPPALLLVAAALAFVAHFRRPQIDELEPEVEIIAPVRGERRAPNPMESDDGVTIPSFAEAQGARSSPRGMADEEQIRGNGDDSWNPRKRRPPPPRAKPAFRQLDDEEDDEEPSGFSRFALGMSGILSFGLYAALAGAAVLIFWNFRAGDVPGPTVAAVESPALSSSAPVVPAPSSEPVLAPVLTSSAEPVVSSAEPTPVRLVDPAAPSSEENFGVVVMPTDPLSPPRLSEDTGLPFDEASVSSAEPVAQPVELEPAAEQPAELTEPPVAAGNPTVGPMMPFQMPVQIAAQRNAPGTGPTRVRTAPVSDSGL